MIEPAFLFIAVVAGIILVMTLRVIFGGGNSTPARRLSSRSHFPHHPSNPASPPAPFDSDPLNPMMAVELMNESSSHDTRHFEPAHHHAHDVHHFHDASSVPDSSPSHSHDSSSSFDSSSSSSDSGGSSSCDSSNSN